MLDTTGWVAAPSLTHGNNSPLRRLRSDHHDVLEVGISSLTNIMRTKRFRQGRHIIPDEVLINMPTKTFKIGNLHFWFGNAAVEAV